MLSFIPFSFFTVIIYLHADLPYSRVGVISVCYFSLRQSWFTFPSLIFYVPEAGAGFCRAPEPPFTPDPSNRVSLGIATTGIRTNESKEQGTGYRVKKT